MLMKRDEFQVKSTFCQKGSLERVEIGPNGPGTGSAGVFLLVRGFIFGTHQKSASFGAGVYAFCIIHSCLPLPPPPRGVGGGPPSKKYGVRGPGFAKKRGRASGAVAGRAILTTHR